MKFRSILTILATSLLICSCTDDSTSNKDKDNPSTTPDDQQQTGNENPGQQNDPVTVIECNADNCSATCCDKVCRNTQTSPTNCGTCGHACNDNEQCINGTCKPNGPIDADNCSTDQISCNGTCTDPRTDTKNCGDCGNVCPTEQICKLGKCIPDCGDRSLCGNKCTSLLDDNDNCGKCANACDANQICRNGQCQTDCRAQGESICDHTCVDLMTSNDHCGTCGNKCNADQICSQGTCIDTCDTDDKVICNHTCVDLMTSNDACGNCDTKCNDDQYCSDGTCTTACEEGQLVCDHACTDIQSNHDHCGTCDKACSPNEICQNGVCACPENDPECNVEAPTCTKDQLLCGKTCVDPKTDAKHCGTCGTDCGETGMCVAGACIDCTGKDKCDDGICYDLKNDPNNCGACGNKCKGQVACVNGTCSGCIGDFMDCDGDPENGCESTTATCACKNGETRSCYYGPAGTAGVGACKAGTMTCSDNKWGECIGMVLPTTDNLVCRNQITDSKLNDLNCDGKVDGTEDFDKDGYSICAGDCCDTKAQAGCNVDQPQLINPGMYETAGNGFDDNCNGKIDEPPTPCTATSPYNSNLTQVSNQKTAGTQLAYAMDICDDAATAGYGLVEASVTSMDCDSNAVGTGINVFPNLSNTTKGVTISPKAGNSFAGMATTNFTNGSITSSGSLTSSCSIPKKYKDQHANLQAAAGCTGVSTSTGEFNDGIHLHLKLKAPKNANGFKFDFRFFSKEYYYYLCGNYNDFFLALLTTSDAEFNKTYPDGNIAFDKAHNPVSVNNAFFTSCTAPTCGASFDNNTQMNTDGCPKSLKCIGVDSNGKYSATSTTKRCGTIENGACTDGYLETCAFNRNCTPTGNTSGGATAWLTTQAPIVPGETFELDFYIWDTGDDSYDSAAIIDNFRWITDGTKITVSTDFSDDRT